MVQMPRIDEIRGTICSLRTQKIPASWDGGVSARPAASSGGADQMEWS